MIRAANGDVFDDGGFDVVEERRCGKKFQDCGNGRVIGGAIFSLINIITVMAHKNVDLIGCFQQLLGRRAVRAGSMFRGDCLGVCHAVRVL